ncbi:MAG: DUF86 domain-containing protein, partial [Actinomycetota bacterium]|nr:DUF86 domain-containing protein [Actinomycetota bacterium]
MKNAPNAAARTPAKGGLRLAERIVRQRKRSPAPHAKAERMAGMRDVLIHNYMGVDLIIVWDVVENRPSLLREQISGSLEGEA